MKSQISDAPLPYTLTPRDVAKRLGVTDRTIRNWITSGRIEASRVSERRTRIPLTEVERLVREAVLHRRPDLSSVLWDVNPATIDERKNARFLIARILEAGRPEQVAWMFQRYGHEAIAEVARDSRSLSPRTASAWRALLEDRESRAA